MVNLQTHTVLMVKLAALEMACHLPLSIPQLYLQRPIAKSLIDASLVSTFDYPFTLRSMTF